jgi:PhzF family phenazine biosynthesis protein
MSQLRIYQIDAFTDRVFQGNPAAVIPLDQWLEDGVLQSIAAENNLSETAFLVPQADRYHLRWFTPVQEVRLCGHATLASAFVIFTFLEPDRDAVQFETLSGQLRVKRLNELLVLDFPGYEPQICDLPIGLAEGLGKSPSQVFWTESDTNYYAVFDQEADLHQLQPDFARLAQLHPYGTVVTAPGDRSDFACRYFAPSYGIPEDPVTGSIHCALVPYWAKRLGKPQLVSRQVSARGGDLYCEWQGDRVTIGGKAVPFLIGEISL